ncbi:MAG: CBS domain-containing protein [Myxococcales bacterium]|nr:MAG: CBS domain-containing protein [Myxococcales bacterium]
MNVQDIMTAEPIVIQHDLPIIEALALMQESNVRHLPVLEGKKLIGMISDRDLRSVYASSTVDEHALLGLAKQFRAPVSKIMASDVVLIQPEAELSEALDLILEQSVGALPVVDPISDNLVGILSYVDVLRAVREYLP